MKVATLLFILTLSTACSAKYNVEAWQRTSAVPREKQAAVIETDLSEVDALRAGGDLAASRALALQLVAEEPGNAEALFRASRAESDAVFLHHEHEKDQRSLAALSALDYSRRAMTAGASSADALAQHAWALGTSTHLRSMFKRSSHARETKAAIDKTIAIDPQNATAHATNALLNYRLSTLPWMIKIMAVSAPDASLDAAEQEAEAAYAATPSMENVFIFAKVLAANQKEGDARDALGLRLNLSDQYPRDKELRQEAARLLETIEGAN